MSKHKVGDKFIVNIKEVMESDRGTLYRADFSTLVFDDYGLDALDKYDEIQERLELIDELKQVEYNKGLKDAWELADKFNNMAMSEIIKVLGINISREEVFDAVYPQDALAKMKAYEDSKIEVGDVITYSGEKGLVLDKKGSKVVVLTDDGWVQEWYECDVEKTGKHIDIQSILEQIGE